MQKMRTELGKRIRGLRKIQSWSQEELGERADLHPTYVGGIERGERNVSFDNLYSLAAAFNLTLAQFFDFPRERQTRRDALCAQLIGLIRNRSQEDLVLFLDTINAFDRWKSSGK